MARVIWTVGFLVAALATPLAGEQHLIDGKPDLSGKWKAESQSGGQAATWVIQHSPDKIHIQELAGADKVTTDVECGTKAVECPGRIDGEEAKVVLYFNGPALVQFTRKGKDVTKTRRTLSEDGQKLTMEVTRYDPPGEPQTVVLVRAAEPADQQTSAKVQ